MFLAVESLSLAFIQLQTFSMGLRSGEFHGHLMRMMLGRSLNHCVTILDLWHGAPSCRKCKVPCWCMNKIQLVIQDPPVACLLLLQTTRGQEKSCRPVVCSALPVNITISFWSWTAQSVGGGEFTFGHTLLLFLSVLMLLHCSRADFQNRSDPLPAKCREK
jgi:hypothetical protein